MRRRFSEETIKALMDNIHTPNEIRLEFLGPHGLNPFVMYDSSNRGTMFASHFNSRVTICEPEESLQTTGLDKEFHDSIYKIEMPENGRILHVIQKHPPSVTEENLDFQPEITVIYETEKDKVIDVFKIPYFKSFHQHFGFRLKQTKNMNLLYPGSMVPKNTVFAESPSSGSGYFKYGLNVKVAFMSHPGVAEDGLIISESLAKRLRFNLYETRTANIGSKSFPLNLYGSLNHYKCYPDKGEAIRKDGLLMYSRDYDESIYPCTTSIYNLREPDYVFDRALRTRAGDARVIDIDVLKHPEKSILPDKVKDQLEKNFKQTYSYFYRINQAEKQCSIEHFKRFGSNHPAKTPLACKEFLMAMAVTKQHQDGYKEVPTFMMRKKPLDEYYLKITMEYTIDPKIGYKLTDRHGGKGVVVDVWPDHKMPVDQDGNRAELITEGGSIVSRMNIGRSYEHYIASAQNKVTKDCRIILNVEKSCTVEQFYSIDFSLREKALEYVLGFIRLCSNQMHLGLLSKSKEEQHRYLYEDVVVKETMRLYMPLGDLVDLHNTIPLIEEFYKPTNGPVSYIGHNGHVVVTKNSVRIADLYIMLLDKIADTGSAVSTGRLNHFGFLTPVSGEDRWKDPIKKTATKTISETEGRIYTSYVGRYFTAEMMDRSNNHSVQQNIVNNILESDRPGGIESLVDRKKYPFGKAKQLQLVNHFYECRGTEMVYVKEKK